jgi:hypothetical protein
VNNDLTKPIKNIYKIDNTYKSENLISDERINENRNNLLYKSELDDRYIDNEEDIFKFSRLNKRNNETTPHFQKLNEEIINYVKRKTPNTKDSGSSSNQSYSIFTTPLAKQTAEKFGMTTHEINTPPKKFNSTISANLFHTPKNTNVSKSILTRGSKSVDYINKIVHNSPYDYNLIKKSKEMNIEVLRNDNEKIDNNLPFNYNINNSKEKYPEKSTNDNNIIDVEKIKENEIAKKQNSENTNYINEKENNDIEKSPEKNIRKSKINNFNKESIFDLDIKSLTPNKPTISKVLFSDSLIKRKSFSANPIRINKKPILRQLYSAKKISHNNSMHIPRLHSRNNSKTTKINNENSINKTNLISKIEKIKKSNIPDNITTTKRTTKINNSRSCNNKSQKRKSILTELKRRVDPITGIVSKLSVVEDPETGETIRVITSYDPITGNKTETKTITTTTTTMTTTTQSTTTRKTTTIDRENDENDSNEEEREEEIIDLDDFTNETEDDDERIGATDYSTVVYSDEESESMPVNIFTRLNNQNQNDEYYIERKTPQNNNKRFIDENNKKNGSFSVPQIFHKKIRLDESSSQRISPYTVNSKVLNNHQNSFNNIPVVGRFTLPDNDLNSSRFNNIDLLSNYSISKNKLNLSTLKKQYQLEQKN